MTARAMSSICNNDINAIINELNCVRHNTLVDINKAQQSCLHDSMSAAAKVECVLALQDTANKIERLIYNRMNRYANMLPD